uniref:Uncharacterized protein n=1 Tax=Macaca fascicularis TaxID=9541 RepID=A0A7N9CGL1_MACFA
MCLYLYWKILSLNSFLLTLPTMEKLPNLNLFYEWQLGA